LPAHDEPGRARLGLGAARTRPTGGARARVCRRESNRIHADRRPLRLRDRLAGHGHRGAYLLGVIFSFAFCPTLFWLFFGLTVPLALRSAGGLAFPGLFAVGASLPLVAMAAVVGAGLGTASRIVGGLRRAERVLRLAAGTVLILAGFHDTIVYWLL
jgi:hypothetical protein